MRAAWLSSGTAATASREAWRLGKANEMQRTCMPVLPRAARGGCGAWRLGPSASTSSLLPLPQRHQTSVYLLEDLALRAPYSVMVSSVTGRVLCIAQVV
ncbi:unnamed protein product [Urochloa humidicola]